MRWVLHGSHTEIVLPFAFRSSCECSLLAQKGVSKRQRDCETEV